MIFVQMHETVASHDAIGADIQNIFNIINEKHTCYVYAKNRLNSNVNYIDEDNLDLLLENENVVFIFHHSVFWEHGRQKVKRAKGKVIYRYHNVTPEIFFRGYSDLHFSQCEQGRQQTVEMVKEDTNVIWMADSLRNLEELSLEKQKYAICPPFNNTEQWTKNKPDEAILKGLIESDCLNVLFVGRVAPNKGHINMFKVMRDYMAFYDKHIILRIIGKFDDNLAKYNEIINECIYSYGIQKHVEFIGEINDSTLMSYYLGSDCFLCCSEHEGFCVPIVEAQYLGLPIVAQSEKAVEETLGNRQVVLGNDSRCLAAALRKIREDEEARNYLINVGRENFSNRFSYRVIRKQFISEMDKLLGVEL